MVWAVKDVGMQKGEDSASFIGTICCCQVQFSLLEHLFSESLFLNSLLIYKIGFFVFFWGTRRPNFDGPNQKI